MVGTGAGGIGGTTAGGFPPQATHDQAATGLSAPHARSLLAWWQLAGADSLVAPAPRPWTIAALRQQPAAASRSAPAQPRPAEARPAPSPAIPQLASLAALQSWLAEAAPGAVLADGNPESGILIIGEAPSAEDLRTGRPFTGPAGLLLDRMLAAIGLDRSTAYITLLCPRRRVPGPPEPQDIERDLPLTRTHIRLAAARHILLLGGTPAQALTGNTTPISQLRGEPLDLVADGHRARALATFNPAYLLRRPADKARAWADLLAFRRLIGS